MTNEDFEFCRRGMEEGVKSRHDGGLDIIDVPPLSMDKHIEMMRGGSAGGQISVIVKKETSLISPS